MATLHILGNLAFILVACSFMVKDILWLRSISMTASLCSIVYNYNVAGTPLWVPISWNIFFISLNLYHVVKIIYGNRNINLNEKEKELYRLVFSNLNLLEFSKLIRTGEWKKCPKGDIIVQEHQNMTDLFLIYNGKVDVTVGDKSVNNLKDGQFIGEMSFLSNEVASATVKAIYPTEYIVWNQNKLKELMARNPSIIYSLQAAMGTQLTQALKHKNTT
jgi:hypothetical protein